MNNFENLKSLSLEGLANWLYMNCQFEDSPWANWFDDTYCSRCEPVTASAEEAESKLDIKPWYNEDIECAPCELTHKCERFYDMEEIPDELEIIKLWLRQEM
jgi:hypothetical protein